MAHTTTDAERKLLKKLGEKVKAVREKQGLTLEQVAFAINKDRQSISRLENGGVNPTYIYLVAVAKGLNVSVEELLP